MSPGETLWKGALSWPMCTVDGLPYTIYMMVSCVKMLGENTGKGIILYCNSNVDFRI